jgi:hypothetical protein
MYDEVYCEADPMSERGFQTKSLFRCLDRLTITKEGRLILHAFRYQSAQEAETPLPLMTRIPEGDIDLEFHGDIRLTSTGEDHIAEYVARFTDGNVTWVRPWTEISEVHKSLLNAVD